MALPYQTQFVDGFWNREWRVNGVWNDTLREVARAAGGQWQISPEAYPNPTDTQGLMADLLVQQIVANPLGTFSLSVPIILYEGKGKPTVGGADWVAVREQLELWCYRQRVNNPDPIWVIGVIGNGIKFWMYSSRSIQYNNPANPTNSCMVPFEWNLAAGAAAWNWNALGNTADAGASYGYARGEIAPMLQFMFTHPRAAGMLPPAAGRAW